MRYTNSTPFPSICFESSGPGARPFHTVVVRATTTVLPGEPLRLADEQLPLNFTDRYFGKPGESSLQYPSDLAPFKPKADIIVNATAYPPKKSSRAWAVAAIVGEHRKSLVVTGPLHWQKRLFRWVLSPFKPAQKVPIRYESAFGGCFVHLDHEGTGRVVDVHRENPVGKGWISSFAEKVQGGVNTIPAAQLYASASDVPPVFGKEYAVEGLGAIAPSWGARQRYVGTWDATVGGKCQAVPADFDHLFFNCAHPDLVVPYLNGDERVQLVNLTPEGKLEFQLPGHAVSVAARYSEGSRAADIPAFLDTLIIEPDEMRTTLVWRATVPIEFGLEALEAQAALNEQVVGKEPGHE